jgi:DNA helicase IV
MRIITSTDLSDEQEDILFDAPLKDVVLITGPPGSGKTVMAFLRAQALSKKFDIVSLIMYNKVLSKFSENGAQNNNKIDVRTMHSWVWRWWKGVCRNVKIPEIQKWSYDWGKMFEILLDKKVNESLDSSKLHWNHVILDEGQDFDNAMYEFLNQVRSAFFRDQEPPSMTILADENQRLQENNSTLKEIKKYMKVPKKLVFGLTKNYRNTDEINNFIANFYVGSETGITKSSGRKGEKPKLVQSSDFSSSIKFISRYARLHQNQEIAIFVSNNMTRNKYYNALDDELGGEYCHVQTFASGSKVHSAEVLRFDREGVVTVLNKQSCKGLEFDAVFIPELENIRVDDGNLNAFKMEMYVMCSRARSYLALILSNSGKESLPVSAYLPDENAGVLEYINV